MCDQMINATVYKCGHTINSKAQISWCDFAKSVGKQCSYLYDVVQSTHKSASVCVSCM